MPIRPIDIRRKEFSNGFRGYDANQVDDFLDTLADEFERNYNENQRMRQEVSGLRDRLQQFEDLEGSIRAALVHAERAANDLRRSANQEAEDVRQGARREAELTIRDAQARSHQMLADSSSQIERVQESYGALQESKKRFANDFRHLLKAYMSSMENMEVSSTREIEASLRERLDTESIAVVREAAVRQEPAAAAEPDSAAAAEPAFGAHDTGDVEDPDATPRIKPAPVATGDPERTGPLAEGPYPEEASADEQETQVLRAEEPTSTGASTDEPGDDGSDRVVWSTETSAVAQEPAAEEPPVKGSAADEPRASEEVEQREPMLAEESSSQETFDRGSSDRWGGDSRISRASRFFRRRG